VTVNPSYSELLARAIAESNERQDTAIANFRTQLKQEIKDEIDARNILARTVCSLIIVKRNIEDFALAKMESLAETWVELMGELLLNCQSGTNVDLGNHFGG
jgi:hypothetical protein